MKYLLSPIISYVVLFLLFSVNSHSSPMTFGSAACEKKITDPSVNAIIKEVFENKFKKLAHEGKLSNEFWLKNKDLIFAICDNKASYDTFVVYEKGVVFDYQMIVFLFAQSRALIVGSYISKNEPFDVYDDLVRQFVKQGLSLMQGPLVIIEKKATDLGMSKVAFDKMLSEPDFKRREQIVFLQAIYFLSMHERCHVALDHGTQLQDINNMSDEKQPPARKQLELDADRCAMNIINADEAHFKSSPVSYFGVLMTVATQSIITNQSTLGESRSHPSTRNRLINAQNIALKYILASGFSDAKIYETTVRGTTDYFDKLLAEL